MSYLQGPEASVTVKAIQIVHHVTVGRKFHPSQHHVDPYTRATSRIVTSPRNYSHICTQTHTIQCKSSRHPPPQEEELLSLRHPQTNIVQKSHIPFTLSPFTHNTLSQTLTLIEMLLVLPRDTHNSLVLPILVPSWRWTGMSGTSQSIFDGSSRGAGAPEKIFAVVTNSEPYMSPHTRALHLRFPLAPPGETEGTGHGAGRGGWGDTPNRGRLGRGPLGLGRLG